MSDIWPDRILTFIFDQMSEIWPGRILNLICVRIIHRYKMGWSNRYYWVLYPAGYGIWERTGYIDHPSIPVWLSKRWYFNIYTFSFERRPEILFDIRAFSTIESLVTLPLCTTKDFLCYLIVFYSTTTTTTTQQSQMSQNICP